MALSVQRHEPGFAQIGLDRKRWQEIFVIFLDFFRVMCHVNLFLGFRDITAAVHIKFGGLLVYTEGNMGLILSAWFSLFLYLTSAITYVVLDISEEMNWVNNPNPANYDLDVVILDTKADCTSLPGGVAGSLGVATWRCSGFSRCRYLEV